MDENDIIAVWGDQPWALRMSVTQQSAGGRQYVDFSVMAIGHAGATKGFQIPAAKIPAIIAALTRFGLADEGENA